MTHKRVCLVVTYSVRPTSQRPTSAFRRSEQHSFLESFPPKHPVHRFLFMGVGMCLLGRLPFDTHHPTNQPAPAATPPHPSLKGRRARKPWTTALPKTNNQTSKNRRFYRAILPPTRLIQSIGRRMTADDPKTKPVVRYTLDVAFLCLLTTAVSGSSACDLFAGVICSVEIDSTGCVPSLLSRAAATALSSCCASAGGAD